MGKVLVIGAGGVSNVAVKKMAQVPEVFTDICLASRTLSKCEKIQSDIEKQYKRKIKIAQVDADKVDELVKLIDSFKPDIVVNLALPYQDLPIMDACVETGVHYLDTANYEPPEKPIFEYKWQWAYDDKFKDKKITAILGCGFDPGVTNVFCAYAQKHLFDEIKTIDILDCNAGSHGHPFATNFNPEINIREVTQKVKHWKKGKWIESPPILNPESIHFTFKFPIVGKRECYMLFHEELESLVKHIKGLERIRFWMTFSDSYLTHLRVLHNLGITRYDEIEVEGQKVVPLKVLKALLPDPASLGKNYKGKTVIGCIFDGFKNGKRKRIYIYNVCDHEEAYKEVQSQAISYTTGVPAMIGAMMVLKGIWNKPGVWNIEQLDPDPFMEALPKYGLPWKMVPFRGKLPD